MKRIDPGIMIVGEELVLAKYDTDKDGKLSDEEIAVLQADVKKAQEAKKAAILKKFDKDGDGKLSQGGKERLCRKNGLRTIRKLPNAWKK